MDLKGKIAFSSGKHGDYDIFVLDLATKEMKQLTQGSCNNDSPRWSPSGNEILYVSNETGVPEIWLMQADGTGQKQLTTDGKWHATPDWSPDGSRIVYSSVADQNIDIYIMDASGENVERITTHGDKDFSPHFSPDGNKVIFSSKRTGNSDIWTYDLSSKTLLQLTEYQGRDYAPRYSPDGSKIAFVSGLFHEKTGEEVLEVYLMDADGNNKQRVTKNFASDRYVSWSPDGKFLIYTTAKIFETSERLAIFDIENNKSDKLEYDREMLEAEIDSLPQSIGLFSFLPEKIIRMGYPEHYFGTEKSPDWKN